MNELKEAEPTGMYADWRMWPERAYEQSYHTVAECEAVIKSLREMVDRQQEYINRLLLENQRRKMEEVKQFQDMINPDRERHNALRESDLWKRTHKGNGKPYTEEEWKQLWAS